MDSFQPLRKRSPVGCVDFEREYLPALPAGFTLATTLRSLGSGETLNETPYPPESIHSHAYPLCHREERSDVAISFQY